MRRENDVYKDYLVDKVIYEAIKKDIRNFVERLKLKYGPKIKEIKRIKDSQTGLDIYNVNDMVWKFVKQDKDLKEAVEAVGNMPLVTKNVVKRVFKDCFNELLDEETNIIVNGKVKTKRFLLAEKILNGVMNDTLDPVTLKGFEVIRDTVLEKPANEVISKGIQQKIIDVNITQEKVQKVKNLLDGLRGASISDGLRKNIKLGTGDTGTGDEGDTETCVSWESEGIHNPDVLPDKQD